MTSRTASCAVPAWLLVLVSLTACAPGVLSIPRDPDGTSERVTSSGVLRAGAAPRPGWVSLPAEAGEAPTGPEPELIEGFATSLGVEVEWTVAGEEYLVDQLSHGQLDLVVGGLTDKNPWVTEVALTRVYVEERNERGAMESHVMAVPLGENAWQSELESWLDRNPQG